jgi:ATP-dependent Clp protease adaptor protein ClpS
MVATALEPRRRRKVKELDEPRLAPSWKVVLHDDDTTTFAFVVELLRGVFKKPAAEAERLTWEVHKSGTAVVEITSLERGELYVEQVHALARPRGFPLCATLEPERP